MPKTTKLRKNCRIEVEWLEPASDIGSISIVPIKKIHDYEAGLVVGQTVTVQWGSRRYKAIVRNIRDKAAGITTAHDDEVTAAYDPFPPIVSATATLLDADLTDLSGTPLGLDMPCPPNVEERAAEEDSPAEDVQPLMVAEPQAVMSALDVVVRSTETQTDGVHVSTETVAAIQNQLSMLFAMVSTMAEDIKQLRTSQATPTTSQQTSRPDMTKSGAMPRYGNLDCQTDMVKSRIGESGNDEFVQIPRREYDRIFNRTRTATSFVRQLLPYYFSKDELQRSNFDGNFDGGVVLSATGKTTKLALDRQRVGALFRQVETKFSGSTSGKESQRKLREAINDKCRHL